MAEISEAKVAVYSGGLISQGRIEFPVINSTLVPQYINNFDGIMNSFFTPCKAVPDVCRGYFENSSIYHSVTEPSDAIRQRIYSQIRQTNARYPNRTRVEFTRYAKKNVDKAVLNLLPNEIPTSFNPYRRAIVLVVESPHHNEYLYFRNDMIPLVPASNSTGTCIHNRIGCVLSSILEILHELDLARNLKFPAPLIVCNPIQYQTSMHFLLRGKLNATVRNNIWSSLWNFSIQNSVTPFRDNFIERLSSYNPQIIINACTSGGSSQLANKVCDAIDDSGRFENTFIFSSTHPSYWWDDHQYNINWVNRECYV